MRNLLVIYKIEKIDKNLDGLVFTENNNSTSTIKIPFTIVNEEVDVKKIDAKNHPAVALDFNILSPSARRKAASCIYYSNCGGCKGQHFNKEDYLLYKLQNLYKLLKLNKIPLKGEITMLHHWDNPFHHRRRAIFSVKDNVIGFNQYRSNKLVGIDYCEVLTENINLTLKKLHDILRASNSPLRITEIIASDLNGSIDLLVKSKIAINLDVITAFQEIFTLACVKRVYWQRQDSSMEALIIKENLFLQHSSNNLSFTSGGFLQPELWGEQQLHQLVVEHLVSPLKVLDLFSGTSPYGFLVLENFNAIHIEAFDITSSAMDSINVLKNPKIKAISRNLMHNPLKTPYIDNFDTVIINPPRNGAKEQIMEISKATNIKQIAMIYCSAESAIRDLSILLQGNKFNLDNIVVVDQFIYTPHIEVFLYLKRI